jgi:hypothetical protein
LSTSTRAAVSVEDSTSPSNDETQLRRQRSGDGIGPLDTTQIDDVTAEGKQRIKRLHAGGGQRGLADPGRVRTQ